MISAKSRSLPCHLIVNQSNMEEFFKGKGVSSKILAELVKKSYIGMFGMADKIIIPDFPLPHTVCRKNLEFKERPGKKYFSVAPSLARPLKRQLLKTSNVRMCSVRLADSATENLFSEK